MGAEGLRKIRQVRDRVRCTGREGGREEEGREVREREEEEEGSRGGKARVAERGNYN